MSMAIGSSVKIALAYWLIGIEQLGLAGAPISTFACDIIINVINLAFVGKYVDTIPDFTGIFLRPFAMSAVAVSVARIFYNVYADRIFNDAAATVLAIFIAGALYCVAVISFGELKRYGVRVKLKKNN
jgi:stage V sporulation protein B